MGIAVLGPLTIEGEAKVLGRRDRIVLAALVVRPGDVVSAGELADAIWGEQPPASAAKVIQGCVVRLRKILGTHAIETSPLGYRLAMPTEEIDAHRFERAVDRARELLAADDAERSALVLADALALWRGRPLTEVDGWDPGRIESARLLELRHAAEELYVESALRAGRHDAVLAKAQALVAEAPLRERRWLLLATAQYQSGRQGEALITLRKLRAVLDRDLGLDPAPEIDALEQSILRQDPALVVPSALPEPSPVCPYPGLASYDVDDSDGFFGRDADVAACLRALADDQVVAVVGPSGCGKSSLVRAGVVAALRRDGRRVAVMTPGLHPIAALAVVTTGLGPPPVLVVDQCEEVFSVCSDAAERKAFLGSLTAHAALAPLILALRADGLTDVAAHPGFARLIEQGLHLLTAMTDDGLRTAITEPARLAALVVEPGLVDLLVNEVAGRPGALPLMSHALAETWQRREGRTMTVAGYNASGGIRGAVAQSAEEIYAQVPAGQRPQLRDLLLRLVTLGPDGEPVRNRRPRRTVVTGPENDAVLDRLIASRLVSSDDEVELAHEALARAWPRLRDWLADDLEGQRILHHLAAAADSWQSLGRPDSELYRGVRLAKALDWQQSRTPELTETEEDFLAAGKRLSEAELHAAAERNRRLRTALSTIALLLVGALIAGFVAIRQADRADREADSARQLAVAADARRVGARAQLSEDISLSLLLAIAGARLAESPETQTNLTSALARHPRLIRSAAAGGGDLSGMEISPDGRLLASGDALGRLHLYDTSRNQLLGTYAGLPRRANQSFVEPAFSPDGRLLAVGSEPGPDPLRLLDPATMQESGPRLTRPDLPAGSKPYGIAAVRFSAGSARLVATAYEPPQQDQVLADVTGFALVWDLRNRRLRPAVIPLGKGMNGMVLSRDGTRMYTAWPMTAYDVTSGQRLWRRDDLPTYYAALDLSPDGSRLVGEYHDFASNNTMFVLDARTGADITRLRDHADQPRDLRFSYDGTMLASASHDGEVIVWDTKTWRPVQRWRTFEQSWAIAFSRDDRWVFTGGDDGMLRTWDLSAQDTLLRRTATVGGAGIFEQTDLSPDGRRVAYRWFTGDQGWIRFADTVTGVATWPQPMPGWEGPMAPGVWHSDGQRYASHAGCAGRCAAGGAISLLDPVSGRLLTERRVATGEISSLAYLDNNQKLLAGSAGGLTVLDARTLRPVDGPWPVPSDCCIASWAGGTAALVLGNSPDGASEHWRVVDTSTGEVGPEGDLDFRAYSSAATPDGTRVAVTGQSGEVVSIDLATGGRHEGSTGLPAEVLSVRVSADGTRLVTGAADGGVSLWDVGTMQLFGTAYPPQDAGEPVGATAQFVAGSTDVVIAAHDGGIYRWETGIDHTLDVACRMAGRNLSAEEWARSLPDQPYRKVCPQFG